MQAVKTQRALILTGAVLISLLLGSGAVNRQLNATPTTSATATAQPIALVSLTPRDSATDLIRPNHDLQSLISNLYSLSKNLPARPLRKMILPL